MSQTWINWAKNETSNPKEVVAPQSIGEVQDTVKKALDRGLTVKPIGASHSFTSIGATDGIRINFNKMQGLVSHDASKGRVTLWAGTHLWQLPAILDPLGLALPNMGDIDAQTIAGATQTGTHGTGLADGLGGLATVIVGVELVNGAGDLVTIDESTPELLSAAALSLGALGVIVTITLQCVPRYLLRAAEAPAKLEDVLNSYVDTVRAVDHFEFFWFPHTKSVRTKTNTRLPIEAGRAPLTKFSKWIDEEFVNNDLLGAVLAIENKFPKMVPRTNRLIETVSSKRTYTDYSYKIYITKRRVRFKESEFAVPLEAVPEVMREINAMIERKKMLISFPIEVRNSMADSLMMSTANGRQTGYIAVHRYYKEDEREYFNAVWEIMRAHEGRPHWGKMHDYDQTDISSVYTSFDDFIAIRNQLDPNRVFANPYLERVLGK